MRIQRRDDSKRDAAGGVLRRWVDIGDAYCQITSLSGRELFEANSINARMTIKVEMRHFSGNVRVDDRLLFRDRVFNILSVSDPEERRRGLELRCEEEPKQSGP